MSTQTFRSTKDSVDAHGTAYNEQSTSEQFLGEIGALAADKRGSTSEGGRSENFAIAAGSEAIARFGNNECSDLSAQSAAGSKQPAGPGSVKTVIGKQPAQDAGSPLKSNSAGNGDVYVSKKEEGVYAKSKFVPSIRRGKVVVDSDTELFPFNYVAGRRSDFTLSVGRDDRMSPAEAKAKLASIFEMYGISGEPHEYQYTFTHALLVTHALNGASMVGPGRASFSVGSDEYAYGDVVKLLGSDSRRFYRAYADETAKALLSVLHRYDPGDSGIVRLCGQIRSIAVNKRLTQFPYLIHDSADACYRTTVTEMAAIARSKLHVLDDGNAPNSITELEKSVKA